MQKNKSGLRYILMKRNDLLGMEARSVPSFIFDLFIFFLFLFFFFFFFFQDEISPVFKAGYIYSIIYK